MVFHIGDSAPSGVSERDCPGARAPPPAPRGPDRPRAGRTASRSSPRRLDRRTWWYAVKCSKCELFLGLWTFSIVTTRPGLLSSRPTRLVAWMYSAVVLGLTAHDHEPESRDVHSDRDHVRRERHIHGWPLLRRDTVERLLQALLCHLHLVGGPAARELHALVRDATVDEVRRRLPDPPPEARAEQARPYLFLDDAL